MDDFTGGGVIRVAAPTTRSKVGFVRVNYQKIVTTLPEKFYEFWYLSKSQGKTRSCYEELAASSFPLPNRFFSFTMHRTTLVCLGAKYMQNKTNSSARQFCFAIRKACKHYLCASLFGSLI
jgi:hypothetical protein